MCCCLPIIQSILAQFLAHVSNKHTRQSQQGPGISHLQHICYRRWVAMILFKIQFYSGFMYLLSYNTGLYNEMKILALS